MKIQIGDGRVYEVAPEVLDYLTLQYGVQLLKKYEALDGTLQFGMKLVSKKMVTELLKTFGVSGKLPRGTDPSEYLIRAYIILMRESLAMANLRLVTDEALGTIEDQRMNYDDLEAFTPKMAGYLEELKHVVPHAGLEAPADSSTGIPAASDQRGAGAELAAGGEASEWEDDGGETPGRQLVPAFP